MEIRPDPIFRRELLCFTAIALLLHALPARGQPLEPLFVPLEGPAAAAALQSTPVPAGTIDRQVVGIRFDRLFDAAGLPAPRVLIDAAGRRWIANLHSVAQDAAGFRSWIGIIDGLPDSHVIVTVRDGIVAGAIDAGDVVAELRTDRPGVYVIDTRDRTPLRLESPPVVAPIVARDALTLPLEVARDEGGVIDVLMVYTPTARARVGGTAQMQALISRIVADTNTSFARSDIATRIRLAGSTEVSFAETSDMLADLRTLSTVTPARWLRNAARADLVHLLVYSPTASSCGVGYQLSDLGLTDFEAYSLADVDCADRYTSTHELGHTMGANHAPEDGAFGALFPYSHGYKDPERRFRTMMAYECAEAPCPRLLQFSNPRLTHEGRVTGTAAHDNARSINEASTTVANFRQSTIPSTAFLSPSGLRSQVAGNAVVVSWDPVAASGLPPVATYVLEVGTTPGGRDVYAAAVGTVTSLSGSLPAGTYYWRVTAMDVSGASGVSADAVLMVGGGCTPPAAPLDLAAAVQGALVTLTWRAADGAAAPESYLLEAGSGPGLADLARVVVTGATSSFTAMAPAGTYHVRVRAQNACGASASSNEHVVTVQ